MNQLYMAMNEIISRRDESMSGCYPHSRKKLIGLGSIWGRKVGVLGLSAFCSLDLGILEAEFEEYSCKY